MAVVGANQWKGGFLKYKTRENQMETFNPSDMDPDSYLGINLTQHNTVKNREVVVQCLKVGNSFQTSITYRSTSQYTH